MTITKGIAFFDAKPYDRKSFDAVNKIFGFDISCLDAHFNEITAELTCDFDAVCTFGIGCRPGSRSLS